MEGKKNDEAADDGDNDDDDGRGAQADIMPSRAAFVPWCVRFWTAVREGKGLVCRGKKTKVYCSTHVCIQHERFFLKCCHDNLNQQCCPFGVL